jgi:flagellar motor switch protein FliG
MSETTTPTAIPQATAAGAAAAAKLSGHQKAAVLCLAMGDEFTALVMKGLDERDLERLMVALAQARNIPRETATPIIAEYQALIHGAEWFATGGIDHARALLEKSVGHQRAEEILRRIQKELDDGGLNRLRKADSEQLTALLRNEHPQTIALILAHLESRQASAVISGLEAAFGADVLLRMARMEKVSPDMLEHIETALGGQALNMSSQMSRAGGPAAVAEVLNNISASLEQELLEMIGEKQPELVDEIKNLMFVFEDLLRLDDKSLAVVLSTVDKKDLALALKKGSDTLKEKIFTVMVPRAADALRDEMGFLGPVRVKDADAAQGRVIQMVRKLSEELDATGRPKVNLNQGGEGDALVE